MPDPTSVPDVYSPNDSMTWVQKATYIWALHPANPLKDDKLQNDLVYSSGGANLPTEEGTTNILSLGGHDGDGKWFESSAPFIFGDDFTTSGNQTPPTIGGFAMWIKFRNFGPASFPMWCGQPWNFYTPMIYNFGASGQGHATLNGTISTGVLSTDTWYHICFQNDATNGKRLYVNGALYASAADTSGAAINSTWYIGYNPRESTSVYRINASIRLFTIICGANWTDAEVAEMYDRPFGYYAAVFVPALPASFALNGQSATLTKTSIYAMTADAASFALTGQDAEFSVVFLYDIVADVGAFAFSGEDVAFSRTYVESVDAGAFTHTGIDTSLMRGRLFVADAAAFALSGIVALLMRGSGIAMDAASFTMSGIDIEFINGFMLMNDNGVFILTMLDANLLKRLSLAGEGRIWFIPTDARIWQIPEDRDIYEL